MTRIATISFIMIIFTVVDNEHGIPVHRTEHSIIIPVFPTGTGTRTGTSVERISYTCNTTGPTESSLACAFCAVQGYMGGVCAISTVRAICAAIPILQSIRASLPGTEALVNDRGDAAAGGVALQRVREGHQQGDEDAGHARQRVVLYAYEERNS